MSDEPQNGDDGLAGRAKRIVKGAWDYARSDDAKAKLAQAKKKGVEVGGAASTGAKILISKAGQAASHARERADEFSKSEKTQKFRSGATGFWDRIKVYEIRGVPWPESPIGIGLSLVFLFPLGLWLLWKNPAWPRTRKVGWTGAWVGLMLLAVVIRGQERAAARRDFAEAGTLWLAGNRAEAASKYKTLLGDRSERLAEADRSILYQRVIEIVADRGATEDARRLIDEARRSKIPLMLPEGRASAMLAEVVAEREARTLLAEAEVDKPEGGGLLATKDTFHGEAGGEVPLDVSPINYSKGPHGEPILTREGMDEGLKATETGFLDPQGVFHPHGPRISWYQAPSGGTPGAKESEAYFVDGKQHGLSTGWDRAGRGYCQMLLMGIFRRRASP